MWNLKDLNTDMSLYLAIVDALERDIKNGILKPGDKLPTQRELAKIVGVNLTTVTRAYKEATKRGLIFASVGNGTYISNDLGMHTALLDATSDNTSTVFHQRFDIGLAKPLEYLDPDIRPIVSEIMKSKDFMQYLRYTPPQGFLSHREIAASWISHFHIHADASHILITSGTNHALTCILSALFKPGDKLAVDCYTYPGIKAVAKRFGILLEAIDMDEEGMTPASLWNTCHRTTIKGVYTMPFIQNPTGAIRSEKRTQQLLSIIKKYQLISIEDDMYGYLLPTTQVPLAAYYPENSIFISGMSKVCYPGLRTSFVVAPDNYYNLICQAIIDTISMTSSMNVAIICYCITNNLVDTIAEKKRAELALRETLLYKLIDPNYITYSKGSMFAWIRLPNYWTPKSITKACAELGVTIMPAEKFVVGSLAPLSHIRISLSAANTLLSFKKGLTILADLINKGPY